MHRQGPPVAQCSLCRASVREAAFIGQRCGEITGGQRCQGLYLGVAQERWSRCDACAGFGRLADLMCETCAGDGYVTC